MQQVTKNISKNKFNNPLGIKKLITNIQIKNSGTCAIKTKENQNFPVKLRTKFKRRSPLVKLTKFWQPCFKRVVNPRVAFRTKFCASI